MQQIVPLIQQYGLAFVFLNVLLQQGGLPVPSYPTLILTGALLGLHYSPLVLLAVAVAASLCADLAWFRLGHRYGSRMLRTICRISLSPDSCIRQTEGLYLRWGPKSLIVAKLIPGFASVATTLAGSLRTPIAVFIVFDALGALLWAGIAIALGHVLRDTVGEVLAVLAQLGRIGMVLLLVALALFILNKWWRRRLLILQLRMDRISVAELADLISRDEAPVILDVRSQAARDAARIPGALPVDISSPVVPVAGLAADAEVVIYCSCPNEISAAKVAKALMLGGFKNVRPLAGGIEAWQEAGLGTDSGPAK
ncbi:DedA family protein/thiosulfate sulfurtransferase GlpE [Chitinimonas sp.]|uniref:DedA family protein/thiosulfate sulfurtransferase GlpE n=1 Tax=Chitinimonas sp. TaxID=1934313 RepID=UPI0035B384C3